MLRKLGRAFYRGVFWTYARGTWQYDVMAILILAFIFLTPRDWFHDKPAPVEMPSADVVLLVNGETHKVYRLRAALIDPKADATAAQGAQRLLRHYTGKSLEIIRIEPARDSRGEVVNYTVWVRE